MNEEGDTKTFRQLKKQGKKNRFVQRLVADVRNVFPSVRLRCIVQAYNGYNGLILGSGRRFLFYFGSILYIVYFTVKILQ